MFVVVVAFLLHFRFIEVIQRKMVMVGMKKWMTKFKNEETQRIGEMNVIKPDEI